MSSHVRVIKTVKYVKKPEDNTLSSERFYGDYLAEEYKDLMRYFKYSVLRSRGTISAEQLDALNMIIVTNQGASKIEKARNMVIDGKCSISHYNRVAAIHREDLADAIEAAKKGIAKPYVPRDDIEPYKIDLKDPKREKHKIKKIVKDKDFQKKLLGAGLSTAGLGIIATGFALVPQQIDYIINMFIIWVGGVAASSGFVTLSDLANKKKKEKENGNVQQVIVPEEQKTNNITATMEVMNRREYTPSYHPDVPTIDFEKIKEMEREYSEKKKSSQEVPTIEVREESKEGGFSR